MLNTTANTNPEATISYSLEEYLFSGHKLHFRDDVQKLTKEFELELGEETKEFDVIFYPFLFAKELCTVAIIKDQTFMKKLEHEKTAKKYQKLMMATITHELRTPLNGIISMLELIGPSLKSPEDRLHLNVALNSSFLMMSLISDILDFSQIESNSLKIVQVAFQVKKVVEECTQLLKLQAEKKRIGLIYKIGNAVPRLITSDKNRYKQVVLNLISNALKFTSQGFIKMKVTYDLLNSLLITRVQDTGIGISQEDQSKLFKLYAKLDSSTKLNPQGNFLFFFNKLNFNLKELALD